MIMDSNTIVTIITILLLFVLAMYVIFKTTNTVSEGKKDYISQTGFLPVEGREGLYYDPIEKIVYIMFSEMSAAQGYGYMSPYYADNGLPYKYDPATHKLQKIEWSAIHKDAIHM